MTLAIANRHWSNGDCHQSTSLLGGEHGEGSGGGGAYLLHIIFKIVPGLTCLTYDF